MAVLRRRARRVGVEVALLLGALVLAATQLGEGRDALRTMREAEPSWLALALVLQIVTYVLAALVLDAVLRRGEQHQPLGVLVRVVLAKQLTDQTVPTGGVAGTLVIVRALTRRGVPEPVATTAVLVDLVTWYAAFALLAAGAFGGLLARGPLHPALVGVAAAFAVLAVGVPGTILALNARGPSRLPDLRILRPVLLAIAEAPPRALRDPRSLAVGTALQALIFALDAATLLVTLHAVGAVVPIAVALTGFVIASVAGMVSLLPGGLGSFEAASVATLHLLGVPLEAALAATAVFRGFSFWAPMVPGYWCARAELVE